MNQDMLNWSPGVHAWCTKSPHPKPKLRSTFCKMDYHRHRYCSCSLLAPDTDWQVHCHEKIRPPSPSPKISKYLDPLKQKCLKYFDPRNKNVWKNIYLDPLWTNLSPLTNFIYTLFPRVYKGGPNISPEIIDPPFPLYPLYNCMGG